MEGEAKMTIYHLLLSVSVCEQLYTMTTPQCRGTTETHGDLPSPVGKEDSTL